jgi:hypothetical protein
MRLRHDLLKFTTADENGLDSRFEGGRSLEKASRVVSVPDRPVLSVKGQPPGSLGCRPPLLRGNFAKVPGHVIEFL